MEDFSEFEYSNLTTKYIRNTFNPLSKVEQDQLLLNMKNGDISARQTLIEKNIRLVISVAKNYIGSGVPLDDLIQEGTIGLIKALEAFDPERGYQLSTYAVHWIKRSIERCIIYQKNDIRLGVGYTGLLNTYNKNKNLLFQKFGRQLTIKEISEHLSLDIKLVEEYELFLEKQRSLNEPLNCETDSELMDALESREDSLEDKMCMADLQRVFVELMDEVLTERQKQVLIYRWGLFGTRQFKQEEVAQILGVTHQRVQQIENIALDKLRKRKEMKELSIYMDYPEKSYEKLKTLRYK